MAGSNAPSPKGLKDTLYELLDFWDKKRGEMVKTYLSLALLRFFLPLVLFGAALFIPDGFFPLLSLAILSAWWVNTYVPISALAKALKLRGKPTPSPGFLFPYTFRGMLLTLLLFFLLLLVLIPIFLSLLVGGSFLLLAAFFALSIGFLWVLLLAYPLYFTLPIASLLSSSLGEAFRLFFSTYKRYFVYLVKATFLYLVVSLTLSAIVGILTAMLSPIAGLGIIGAGVYLFIVVFLSLLSSALMLSLAAFIEANLAEVCCKKV